MSQELLPIELPEPGPAGRTIEQRFVEFHDANPHVYQSLVRRAIRLRRSGVTRWGVKGLFEVLRWEYALQTRGDEYKLNNSFTALYARLLMEQEPALDGFFEVRERKSK